MSEMTREQLKDRIDRCKSLAFSVGKGERADEMFAIVRETEERIARLDGPAEGTSRVWIVLLSFDGTTSRSSMHATVFDSEETAKKLADMNQGYSVIVVSDIPVRKAPVVEGTVVL
jgi:hypothetical protein